MSCLLSGIRAEGSVVTSAVLDGPWTIHFADRAPLTMISVFRGGGTLILADGTRTRISLGDTAIVQGPEPSRLVDDQASLTGPNTDYEISCFTPDSDCAGE